MGISGLSLRDLEYVVSVAEFGHFGKAADHCRVAQPSLSAQIRKTEHLFGTKIFERTTRRVILTDAGRSFVVQAKRVLDEAMALMSLAQNAGAPFGGKLRLAAISTLGPYLFPRIIVELRELYPGMALILSEGLTAELAAKLNAGGLDAALVSLPIPDSSFASQAIFTEPFVLACPKGHRAGETDGPEWDDLDRSERLLLEEGHCLRDQALSVCSVADSRKRQATGLHTLKYMVAAGEGCTLLPALALTEPGLLTYRAMQRRQYSRRIALVWRQSDPRAEQFASFAASLVAIAGKLRLDQIPGWLVD